MKWPSAKTLFLAGALFICVILISLALFADSPSNASPRAGNPAAVADAEGIAWQVTSFDTDNDGLKDWEETLLGTKINDPDSDKDGTGDGEEVREERNPLVPGPSDKKASPEEQAAEEEGTTGEVSKELFAGYLALKQQGLLDNEESRDALLRNLITTTQASIIGRTFTNVDVTIVPDSKEAITKYRQETARVLLSFFEVRENELVTFAKAVTTKDPAELDKLDSPISVYDRATETLLALPVPQDAADEHIALLNSIENLSVALKKMKLLYTDPLGALAGFNAMDEIQVSLQSATGKMGVYLDKSGKTI